ncbi:hypothetical protein DACRYDRAFT_115875 [Dacryopinax primogenitus]|uniref:Uncharacterized protein n=1 Tax=Dacryopinax primogenitus (strain DJM 731) TaxID=1858805 RepID=M5G3Y3_DACPD|nr:uncharacterized protein DACRYDRAFT_115875 [Dacryopinax primogenitus]EJU02920.1 hypothetical protein DACRYDRAFT_115875 [Dacryopinax primogenitus]
MAWLLAAPFARPSNSYTQTQTKTHYKQTPKQDVGRVQTGERDGEAGDNQALGDGYEETDPPRLSRLRRQERRRLPPFPYRPQHPQPHHTPAASPLTPSVAHLQFPPRVSQHDHHLPRFVHLLEVASFGAGYSYTRGGNAAPFAGGGVDVHPERGVARDFPLADPAYRPEQDYDGPDAPAAITGLSPTSTFPGLHTSSLSVPSPHSHSLVHSQPPTLAPPLLYPEQFAPEPETSFPIFEGGRERRESKLSVLSWGKKIEVAYGPMKRESESSGVTGKSGSLKGAIVAEMEEEEEEEEREGKELGKAMQEPQPLAVAVA